MDDLKYDTQDSICALATPWGTSGLATIRMTGRTCVETFSPFFSRSEALTTAKGGRAFHGHVLSKDGESLDEVVVTVWRSPHSYTGQDSLELSCHGSPAVLRRVLAELTFRAFRPAGPGEFTLRAFLAGKLDLTRAEAVQEIVTAKTDEARAMALHRLGGSVENRVLEIRRRLLDLTALLNVQLDYAEDEVDTLEPPFALVGGLIADVEGLASTFRVGRVLQEGLKVALVGRTNAGKSSLFNLFLKEDRSIVSEEHGTTRDFIEAWVNLGGIPLRFYDTAGLRETDSEIEREGIRRSRELVDAADLVFYLVDSTGGLATEDKAFLADVEKKGRTDRLIRLWTKADLSENIVAPDKWTAVSTKTMLGFAELEALVRNQALGGQTPSPDVVIDSVRQKNLLDRAALALNEVKRGVEMGIPIDMIALDVQDALQALGEIVGEVSSSDVLNHMFGNFCVGK